MCGNYDPVDIFKCVENLTRKCFSFIFDLLLLLCRISCHVCFFKRGVMIICLFVRAIFFFAIPRSKTLHFCFNLSIRCFVLLKLFSRIAEFFFCLQEWRSDKITSMAPILCVEKAIHAIHAPLKTKLFASRFCFYVNCCLLISMCLFSNQ